MGYSTTLYSVDIGELRAAFGSKDAALLERVREVLRNRDVAKPQVDPPRIFCDAKSDLFLDGKAVTPEELKAALSDPKWNGTGIMLYQDTRRGKTLEGRFRKPGSFFWHIRNLCVELAEQAGVKFDGQQMLLTLEDFNAPTPRTPTEATSSDEDDGFTEDQALEELIGGKHTQPGEASNYGYALEYLVETLGTRLGQVGTDQLKSLKIKTPLSRTKRPVKIPKGEGDFPYISFLDAAETKVEVERLRTMDLSLPKDPENERERRKLLAYLEQAVNQNRGVIGFYY